MRKIPRSSVTHERDASAATQHEKTSSGRGRASAGGCAATAGFRPHSADLRPVVFKNGRGTSLEVDSAEMRKRYRVLVLAAIVAALVVPVGFALSLEAPMPAHTASDAVAHVTPLEWLPDSAKLLLVGATLFGLAAFVRKAV
jgi:hypothetical protein